MKIKKIRFFVLLIVLIASNSLISQSKNLNNYINKKLFFLESTWNEVGYWEKARDLQDNRYNEAIMIYLHQDSIPKKELLRSRIKPAIHFSINYLQNGDGFFLQNGKPSHIRTSLFLKCLAESMNIYPSLIQDSTIHRSINLASKALSEPHEFAFNQNIAAMMCWYSLYMVACDNMYYGLYVKYREHIMNNFIRINNEYGYWPEAPKEWSNRMNKPYLLIQSVMLQEYLLMAEDKKLKKMFYQLNNLIFENIELETIKLNVKGSIGNFSNRNIEKVPISVASFFYMEPHNKSLDKNLKKRILKICVRNFDKKIEDESLVLNTDLYYRFVICKYL